MDHIGAFLTTALALCGLVAAIFLISENRRPQATMAWMLAFLFTPGIGVLVYVFFGRPRKAFSRCRRLLRQDLDGGIATILRSILSSQDTTITELARSSVSHRKLMMLVRRNSQSALTIRNRVEILQDAAEFYGRSGKAEPEIPLGPQVNCLRTWTGPLLSSSTWFLLTTWAKRNRPRFGRSMGSSATF